MKFLSLARSNFQVGRDFSAPEFVDVHRVDRNGAKHLRTTNVSGMSFATCAIALLLVERHRVPDDLQARRNFARLQTATVAP